MHPTLAVLVLALLAAPAMGQSVIDSPTIVPETAWIWSGGPSVESRVAALDSLGLVSHTMPNLEMVSFVAPRDLAHALVAQVGGRLDANEQMDLHLDKSIKAIEADLVRERVGLARDGPTVLVVDTGVDSVHPDFSDSLEANVIPQLQGGLVVGSLEQVPVVDVAGHGTHVASIVAGSGEGLLGTSNGQYEGVYSLGRIASYQVTTSEGDGEPQVDTLASLEAYEWALTHRTEYNIRVVTNSWGAPGDFDAKHAVNQATLRLYLAGMTVVFSAGNEGREGADTLNKYCQSPWVLCVAAADNDGARASFSSYGVSSRPYSHPDLAAPGLQITAAASLGGIRIPTSITTNDRLYTQRSGTSMAAPHVAGTAALLLAANPSMSPDQVMDVLVATTDPMVDSEVKVGSGFLNARSAFNLAVQTVGNRPAFLRGDEVKYAGERSGDDEFAQDPLSVGYDAKTKPAALLAAPEEPLWVFSTLGLLLVGSALLSVLIGIRWGKPKELRQRTPSAANRQPVANQSQDG